MKIVKVLLIFAFFIVILSCIPFQRAVVIESQANKQTLAYIPLQDDTIFQIQYTHSIHLSEVAETFRIKKDGTIRLTELMYEDTSVGMPSNAEPGETFKIKDGKYVISNMKRDMPYIDLEVGRVVANHRLIYMGNTYPIASFAKPGSLVRIRADRLALWQLWKGVNIIGQRS